jgi:2,3-bisphosphoglycerate-dependent phosphoglycerate mutase
MTFLYLVRHAHADWTPDENRPLSPAGVKDAQLVASILANFKITQIISSPYRRARQTIEPFAVRSGVEILEDSHFRERDLGDIGASSFQDAVHKTWLDMGFAFPDGESNLQAQNRAIDGLNEYLELSAHKHIVISTHGNLLALILNHIDPDIGYTFWEKMTMPDIYRLVTHRTEGQSITRIWKPIAGNFTV